jgi:hypothetical protein
MFILSVLATLLIASAEPDATSVTEKPSLKCEQGPVKRVFGDTNWLVYGCDDVSTMVVVSDAGNPASPFYFIVFKEGDGYRIRGEGNGDKAASRAAVNELSQMSSEQFEKLLAETKK